MNAAVLHPLTIPAAFPLGSDVGRAAAGDTGAFERLVEATKRVVTSITFAIMRDIAASEDVAQEVYVHAWRDLPKLKNQESFLPWLRQLARNKSLESLRARRRYDKRHGTWEPSAAEVPGPSEKNALEAAISEEEKLVLREALAALPDDAREVLTLFYREGSSIKHVAELLDLTEAAVKKRLERARTALQAEVLARFEVLVRKTAPGATFTAGVLVAISLVVPSTAAAATAAGTAAAKTLPGVLFAWLAPTALGIAGGLIGVFFGMRRFLRNAIDEQERRELVRFRNGNAAVVIVFTLALSGIDLPWLRALGGGGQAVAMVALMTLLCGYLAWAYHLRLPAILQRRHDRERALDPEGFAVRQRRERRSRAIAYGIGGLSAALGLALACYRFLQLP
jgi:RNA polymerase sigma factor (sigma-70 family)